MLAISFSLTEQFVIDPILTLRAPLALESEEGADWKKRAYQVLESEVAARALAVFTSALAAVDATTHVLTGVCICFYSPSTACAHFQQAAWFSLLTVVGSLAGTVWPELFRSARYAPPSPEDASFAPDRIKQLVLAAQRGQMQIAELGEIWGRSSLEDKRWFVEVLSDDGLSALRAELVDKVYRAFYSLGGRKLQWLSSEEIHKNVNSVWSRNSAYYHSFFYHATSEKALESILTSKKIEVRHEKAFRGAFVSTEPETGFSRDIPVTVSTLAYVILDGGSDRECQELKERCSSLAGRSIEVLSLESARNHLSAIKRLRMGIPEEWPSEDEAVGVRILSTLRARAKAATQSASGRSAFQLRVPHSALLAMA